VIIDLNSRYSNIVLMSQDFYAPCDYLTDFSHPIIHDERLMQYLNKVKGQFDIEDELFKGKDLFRLIGLMTGVDKKVLDSSMRNRHKLKEGGMLDILYKLIPKMFVAGCVWEKYGTGPENHETIHNDSKLNLSKVRRHLDNHHKKMKKLEDQIEGSGMISKEEYESDIKAIKREHKEKIDELQRDNQRLKNRMGMIEAKHATELSHHKHLIKIQEEVISMPSQEEQKTPVNEAPDMIPNEE
jgi:hypothetical protein